MASSLWIYIPATPPRGPSSSVGIVTGYRLDGPGIEPPGDEISRTCPERPWVPPSLLYNGYQVFPGDKKSSRSVLLTPHSLLVPWSRKSTAIPLLSVRKFRPVEGRTLPYLESPIRLLLDCSSNVMAHGDARKGKWRGKLSNAVGSQYPSHYLRTCCIQQ